MFDCEEYHSEFQALEVKRHTPLTDRLVLHYFELQKLPETITADSGLELWLALFNAETEEDLKQLEGLEVPGVSQAIAAYRKITVTKEFREYERLWSKARHDEAQALYNAEQNKAFAIAKNLLKMQMAAPQIAEATGLTLDEIAKIDV
jgi:predicted transposase/invertase (TIGR01784 family)